MLEVELNEYKLTCNMVRSNHGTYTVCLFVNDRLVLQQVWGLEPTEKDFMDYLKFLNDYKVLPK